MAKTAKKTTRKKKAKPARPTIPPRPAHRPSKYKPEYCEALIEYFNVEPYKNTKHGREPNLLPTLRDFAKSISCGVSTVYDWLNSKHPSFAPKFSEAFICARDLRKDFLIQNGLLGLHNPAYAKFVAVNLTDMRDKTDNTEHKGVDLTALQAMREAALAADETD